PGWRGSQRRRGLLRDGLRRPVASALRAGEDRNIAGNTMPPTTRWGGVSPPGWRGAQRALACEHVSAGNGGVSPPGLARIATRQSRTPECRSCGCDVSPPGWRGSQPPRLHNYLYGEVPGDVGPSGLVRIAVVLAYRFNVNTNCDYICEWGWAVCATWMWHD